MPAHFAHVVHGRANQFGMVLASLHSSFIWFVGQEKVSFLKIEVTPSCHALVLPIAACVQFPSPCRDKLFQKVFDVVDKHPLFMEVWRATFC